MNFMSIVPLVTPMRAALLLFACVLLPLLTPVQAATLTDTATYDRTQACIVGGTYVLGAAVPVPGCTARQWGTVQALACEDGTCTVSIAHQVQATLPAGVRSITTTVDDNADPSGLATLCSVMDAGAGPTVSCQATRTLTLEVASTCRFVLLDTQVAVDVRAAVASLVDVFRVCNDGTTLTVERL